MHTKIITQLLALCLVSTLLISHKPEVTASREMASLSYDENMSPWEQPNPIFRWPLPKVEGDAVVNVQFIRLGSESSSIESQNLEGVKTYLESLYGSHGINFNFRKVEQLTVPTKDLSENWKTKLPSKAGQLSIFVLADEKGGMIYDYYPAIEIVSDKAVVPFSNIEEFKVYTAKSVGHMLGLLPTYFENSALGVPAEDANNCGHAGDFVCDTPFDYLGLKNDVKKRNCKYKGDMGKPDTRNIMSNSWTECMDRITNEQANKIKYNLSVIPLLQSTLNKASSIKLNVGTAEQPTINQLTLK